MSEFRKYATAAELSTILIATGTRNAQVNPTLATGDVQVSLDDAAFTNIATLPSVLPAGGVKVKITLSIAELTCKRLMIRFVDVAGAEWEEQTILVETFGHASAMHYDMGKILYTGMRIVDPDSENALHIESQSSGWNGIFAKGNGKGAGFALRRGATGRDFDFESVLAKVPVAFAERGTVTSENITRTGYPNMGVIFTTSTVTAQEDFDGKSLIGAKIYTPPVSSADNPAGDREFIILGGYYFDDSTDTTHKVFGVALEIMFGITEGGSVIVNTNWTGTTLDEAGNGSGWTFIVAQAASLYPENGENLNISRSSSLFFREPIINNSLTAQEVRDAMYLAPTPGTPGANSIDDKLDHLGADTADILAAVAAVQSTVDGIAATAALESTSTAILSGVGAIIAKLPATGLISNYDPATSTVDGMTYEYIYELIAALVNGRYALDTPGPCDITFFKRNSTTPLTIVHVAQTGRTRLS